jgi:hypothetical protein
MDKTSDVSIFSMYHHSNNAMANITINETVHSPETILFHSVKNVISSLFILVYLKR